MSNSAFTPSTSTVTNNVPTNVPIITDWTAYTPTLTNFGSKGTNVNTAFWRRNGADIEIIFTYNGNAVAAGAGTNSLQWSLPSGLTFDTTKLPNGAFSDDNYIGSSRDYNVATSAAYSYANQVAAATSTTFAMVRGGTNNYYTTDSLNIARPAYFSGQLKAPISQWAGSGTTTLATRAVEEYASWNGSTTVYGPSGSALPTITASAVNTRTSYVVTWQNAILATDKIVLEVSPTGGTSDWIDVGAGATDANLGFGKFIQQSTGADSRYYGMGVRQGSSTTTSIVEFGNAGARTATAGAYGATGASWTGSAMGYWRLRKISGGAQVGYPVSARNIVGDTSGTTVPVGMLGENYTKTGSDTALSTATTSVVSQSLSAGTWLINAGITAVSSASNTIFVSIYQGTTSTLIGPAAGQLLGGVRGNASVSWVVTLSSTTTMGVAAFLDSGTATANGIRSFFVATRIA